MSASIADLDIPGVIVEVEIEDADRLGLCEDAAITAAEAIESALDRRRE